MNLQKIKNIKSDLDKLYKKLQTQKEFEYKDVIQFVSNCVAIFNLLNLEQNIIDRFISFMYTGDPKSEALIFSMMCGSNKLHSRYQSLRHKYYFIDLAFETAFRKIKIYEDKLKLVPTYLIKSLPTNLKDISTLVITIENNYQNKDPENILSNSRILLDKILDLDPDLKKRNNLSNKIRHLLSNQIIQDKFGISKDFVIGLDNSRLIRNTKLQHPINIISMSIPLAVATSCAFLVISLLEFTIASGKLINDQK